MNFWFLNSYLKWFFILKPIFKGISRELIIRISNKYYLKIKIKKSNLIYLLYKMLIFFPLMKLFSIV
jgi:hypothetical protein